MSDELVTLLLVLLYPLLFNHVICLDPPMPLSVGLNFGEKIKRSRAELLG